MDVADEILAIAHKYLTRVKRSGSENVMAVCPFHMRQDGTEERNPSFALSLTKGVYFCHSCHAKGNLKTFFRDLGIPRAQVELQYKYLIEEAANNAPPPPDPLRPGIWDIPPIEEGLLGLFDYAPVALLQSGFDERTLHHFEIGYDKWHNRITFPLRDLKGNLVGISGRATNSDQEPRYKVYTKEYKLWGLPERPEPDKRFLLWNGHNVYQSTFLANPDANNLVAVEGFKAAMWLWQCGITNTAAILGSYMSWEHQWMFERIGSRITLFLDNNSAGRSGAINAADRLSNSLHVHMVEYPARLVDNDDAQPDSFTPTEAREAVSSAPTYLNWLLRQ